jgi:hypothetical protein
MKLCSNKRGWSVNCSISMEWLESSKLLSATLHQFPFEVVAGEANTGHVCGMGCHLHQ